MEARSVYAVVGLLACAVSAAPARAQQTTPQPALIRTEGVYPRFAARGHKTVINVAVPSPEQVQSAEISPAAGVSVAAITGEGSGSEQNIGWWEVTLDVAQDAAAGARNLVLVLPHNRTVPVTVSVVTHAPAIAGLAAVAPQSQASAADLQMTATDAAGDLGGAPYVWFTAACGGDPIAGTLRATVNAGIVRAAMPNVRLAAHDGIPSTGTCDVQVRLTDASGIESNTLRVPVDFHVPATSVEIRAATAPAEWTEFASKEERFTITFPGQPAVTETTWISQFGVILPARIYSGPQGASRYSVTVVDYGPVERLLCERSRSLPALDLAVHDYGPGYWKTDVMGAIPYAASTYFARDAKVTSVLGSLEDLVSGLVLVLTNNADSSRTFASIYMHADRLIIAEATVPKGNPAPLIFEQSLGWLDEQGRRVRYQYPYHNEPETPKPLPRGR